MVLPRGNYRCDGGAKNTNLSIWLGWSGATHSKHRLSWAIQLWLTSESWDQSTVHVCKPWAHEAFNHRLQTGLRRVCQASPKG